MSQTVFVATVFLGLTSASPGLASDRIVSYCQTSFSSPSEAKEGAQALLAEPGFSLEERSQIYRCLALRVELEEKLTSVRMAEELAIESGSYRAISLALLTRSFVEYLEGEMAASLMTINRSVEAARRSGDAEVHFGAASWLLEMTIPMGGLTAAAPLLEEMKGLAAALPDDQRGTHSLTVAKFEARVLAENGSYDEALRIFHETLEDPLANESVREGLRGDIVSTLVMSGRWQEALDAIAEAPKTTWLQIEHARALKGLRRLEEAEAALPVVSQESWGELNFWYREAILEERAEIFRALDRESEANAALRELRTLDSALRDELVSASLTDHFGYQDALERLESQRLLREALTATRATERSQRRLRNLAIGSGALVTSLLVLLLLREHQAHQARLEQEETFRRAVEEKLTERTDQLRKESLAREGLQRELALRQRGGKLVTAVQSVAHDFRNYLAVLLVNAEKISRTSPESSQELERIFTACEGAERLIQSVTRKRSPSEAEILDPTVVFSEVIDHFRPILPPSTRLTFHSEINESEPITVFAYRSDLEQVALNLLANSREALSNDGGEIRVSVRRFLGPKQHCTACGEVMSVPEDGAIALVCEDSGPGISKEMMSSVFLPRFSTKGGDGSGLGLATVNRVTHQINGHISGFRSDLGGAGFLILLPEARLAGHPLAPTEVH